MKILYSILLAAIIPAFIFSISGLVKAQPEKNAAATSEPTFLFIQHAQSGSISEINATAYALELNDVVNKTILFSDRPDRIVTSVSTSDFIGNWTVGADSFATDPPNAALVVHDDEQREDVAIVELFNPIYDTTLDSLKYDIILENATSVDLPSEFGQSTLVIDDKNNPGSVDPGPGI